ncbi:MULTISPECIES: hypothetical protein [Methylobacterium]|uniref:hypothetical protein n=1 Tax=Methylobacterium TaxID=407 RepID=UPI0012E96C57|nr:MULTISPECIES: hypothetical protein [Methylobacterium]MCI9879549.1 hypothetical protein [Methylobacterium goesingense]
MPYTAHHLYSREDVTVALGTSSSRKLRAESDADAVAEANIWLLSSRIVARIAGDAPPVAEVIWKDGEVFACVRMEPQPEPTGGG